MQCLIDEERNLEFNTKLDRQPVKLNQNRGDVVELWFEAYYSRSSLKYLLKTIQLTLGKAKQE